MSESQPVRTSASLDAILGEHAEDLLLAHFLQSEEIAPDLDEASVAVPPLPPQPASPFSANPPFEDDLAMALQEHDDELQQSEDIATREMAINHDSVANIDQVEVERADTQELDDMLYALQLQAEEEEQEAAALVGIAATNNVADAESTPFPDDAIGRVGGSRRLQGNRGAASSGSNNDLSGHALDLEDGLRVHADSTSRVSLLRYAETLDLWGSEADDLLLALQLQAEEEEGARNDASTIPDYLSNTEADGIDDLMFALELQNRQSPEVGF